MLTKNYIINILNYKKIFKTLHPKIKINPLTLKLTKFNKPFPYKHK